LRLELHDWGVCSTSMHLISLYKRRDASGFRDCIFAVLRVQHSSFRKPSDASEIGRILSTSIGVKRLRLGFHKVYRNDINSRHISNLYVDCSCSIIFLLRVSNCSGRPESRAGGSNALACKVKRHGNNFQSTGYKVSDNITKSPRLQRRASRLASTIA
jgi:hypothetical protein